MGRARTVKGDKNIRVVEAMGVGPHSTIQLVQAGDKYFLIGVSRGGITFLGEVSADSVTLSNKVLPDMPFEKYLSRFMSKKKDESDEDEKPKN